MRRTLLGAVVAAVLLGLLATQGVVAGLPANKVSVSGSTIEVVDPEEDVLLLSEKIRSSSPTDLILSVSAECALTTNLTTTGNDSAKAVGLVKVRVLIDNKPVSVSSADDGYVTFCNRAYQRDTLEFDDEDATIKTFLDSRTANAFNWMALNVGSGTHTVEVRGTLATETSGEAQAKAAIGRRTLIVEPTKAGNRETATDIG